MKRIIPFVAVVALAAAGVTGCNKGPGANTAYNNSGSSATPGSTTTTTTPSTDMSSSSSTTATTAPSDSSGANVVADTVTSGKVMAAITTDPGLKDTEITVKTDGGVVVLGGMAKSQDQVTIATNLAQRQEGVNRVETQITVQ